MEIHLFVSVCVQMDANKQTLPSGTVNPTLTQNSWPKHVPATNYQLSKIILPLFIGIN